MISYNKTNDAASPKQVQTVTETGFVETCIKSRIINVQMEKAQTLI